MTLSGKRVLITGGGTGAGENLALGFAAAGAEVVISGRRLAPLQAVAERASGIRVVQADVTDEAQVKAMFAAAGPCDVVIANAGISEGFDTAEFEDLAVLRDILETNLIGLAATFQPFLHPLRERRAGTLVGVASVAGVRGLPGHGAYCSSKAGVISYCESLRGECRPFGLKVVTISPGFIDTPLTRRNRYPMPFLMSPHAFADSAFRAIEQGASHRVIPWQMGLVARLLKVLPDALFDRAFQGRGRKPRRGE